MPRPGPRPYECVRRAWHSDRHQPIRGSLIQEIFRVANEVHSPATRKNKEWQEKLPLVVLKAEEIMYSKANSEAEYMDVKTLWQRANDAIDTIIRRDDTPETEGDFLQPCIEAALNLGCVPRRASRSQRHNNPGCYLSTTTREATVAVSVKISESSKPPQHLGSSAHLLPLSPPPPPQTGHPQSFPSQFASWYSALATPTNVNYMTPEVKSVVPSTSCEPKDSFSICNHAFDLPSLDSINPCQDGARSAPVGTYTCLSFGRVYPLYYSNNQPRGISQPSILSPQDPLGNIVAASVSSLPSICEAGMGLLHNFIGRNNTRDASNTSSNFGEASDNPSNTGCDLSLRLGMYSPSILDTESAWTTEVEDVGSSSSCDGSKFSDPSPRTRRAANFESSFSSSKDKGFDFFQVDTTDEPLESCSSKWSSEAEGNATRGGF